MATKAEQFHAAEQQKAGKSRKKKPHVSEKKPKKAEWSHDKGHAGKKATHALEEQPAKGARPSRESTRKSANRSKPDSAMNRTEEAKKGTPTNRARKSRASGVKVRGKS